MGNFNVYNYTERLTFDVYNYTGRLADVISAADDMVAWIDAHRDRVWSQADPEWQQLLASYKNLREGK